MCVHTYVEIMYMYTFAHYRTVQYSVNLAYQQITDVHFHILTVHFLPRVILYLRLGA